MKKVSLRFIFLFVVSNLTACSFYQPYENVEQVPGHNHRAHVDGFYQNPEKTTGPTMADAGAGTQLAMGPAIGGSLSSSMDSMDRMKLARALDSVPGKSTHWQNPNSGTSYIVTPIKKVTINDNPYCRTYTVTSIRQGQERQHTGTACVSADGTWQSES